MSLGLAPQDSETSKKVKETPLLSEEGRKLLAGKIDAEEYIEDGRRRLRDLAVREVDRNARLSSSRPIRILLATLGFIAYSALAVESFVRSKDTMAGVWAVITAIIMGFMAGVMALRLRRGASTTADSLIEEHPRPH